MRSRRPTGPDRLLVLACGALANEINHLVRLNNWTHVTLECLPAIYHNTPNRIPGAVKQRLDAVGDEYARVLVGYADCGTGGQLDAVLANHPMAERLDGAHCYEFFATSPRFAELHDAEPGTFYLTDFLVKHFDRFVIDGLGLDRHPELRDAYFGNYRRVVYLAQLEDGTLVDRAKAAAARLELDFELVRCGYGDLGTGLEAFVEAR